MIFNARSRLAIGLLLIAPGSLAQAQEARTSRARPPETPQQAILKALDETFPDHPEWLDEYTDILNDTGLGPNDGWHRRAVSQTRFDWKSVASRLDKDGDGRVARKEFSGSDFDFARLDRDRDGALTKADFEFPVNSGLTVTPGSLFMYVMDEDANGKVTREEFEAFFKKADSGNLDFLSLGDLQENFTTRPRPSPRPAAGPPSKETLIRGLFRQEIGSLQPGPKLDEKAPDFTLKTNDGREEVTLSKLVGQKPIVLVFGNFTCGPFRNQVGNIEKLHRLYKDRANFVMVYVREAHPTDGWRMDGNDQAGIATAQPRTYEDRVAVAQTCGRLLNLGFPMLVDGIDDPVGSVYSGMPNRLYVIDRDGKIAYKSGRGPYGFMPAELEHSLVLLLQTQATKAEAEGASQPRSLVPPREGDGPVKLLSSEEAWKRLPATVDGGRPALPNWARATAHALPRTTAAMLDLDRLHRTRSPLSPTLRGKMRWVVAAANRCDYSIATAEADLRRAGVEDKELADLMFGPDRWPDSEKDALEFARKMSLEASEVTDDEVAALKASYGERRLVAMVLLLASANFQDRLLLSLGTRIEDGGPMPALDVRFSDPPKELPVPDRAPFGDRRGPTVPERVDDPEWAAIPFDVLKKGLDSQKANQGRIRVPSAEEVVTGLP